MRIQPGKVALSPAQPVIRRLAAHPARRPTPLTAPMRAKALSGISRCFFLGVQMGAGFCGWSVGNIGCQ